MANRFEIKIKDGRPSLLTDRGVRKNVQVIVKETEEVKVETKKKGRKKNV